MTLSTYIKEHEVLKELDFVTVYTTIIELLKDEKLEWGEPYNVHSVQSKPE